MTKKMKRDYAGVKSTEADEKLLEKLLEKLSIPHRDILAMDAAGKTVEVMAAEMNCAVGTAKSRLHRARAALVALRDFEAA